MSRVPRSSVLQFAFVAIVGGALIAVYYLTLNEQQPPWEGCRAASKTEYESAEIGFLLQTSFGAYATTGHWWRRYYWYCHLVTYNSGGRQWGDG
jgi:hypothetical protein